MDKHGLQELPGFDRVPQDMRDAIDKFHGEAGEIVDSFLKVLESEEPPSIIYHYTNDVGLRGILETGQLWLTDIFCLNDPSELKHGFSRAMSVLSSKVADGPGVGKLFAKNFAVLDREGAIPRVAHLFMCSFSSRGDDLGQWRAYADNGRGYALGFDSKALENGFTKEGETPIPNNSTFHVKYSDTQLLEIYGRIVGKMLNLILLPGGRGLESATINAYMIELQMRLTLHTLRTALFFKHEAYENEKEYRFMQIHRADEPPSEVKVRSRPYSLVRYREFDWRSVAAGALKQIVVGPGADSQKASQFAQDCVRCFHAGDVEIVSSQIPYRAF